VARYILVLGVSVVALAVEGTRAVRLVMRAATRAILVSAVRLRVIRAFLRSGGPSGDLVPCSG
jgi:hypothetical protein